MLLKKERLEGLHPDLKRVVERAASAAPFDIMVLEGLRTKERQAQLLAQGASTTTRSRHLTGHAVDLAPVLDTDGDGDKEISWHWPHYDKLGPAVEAAACAEGVTIEWGGRWKNFKDGPHFQLPWKDYPVQ